MKDLEKQDISFQAFLDERQYEFRIRTGVISNKSDVQGDLDEHSLGNFECVHCIFLHEVVVRCIFLA